MNIIVAANITPFLRGGADFHINGLVAALREQGHDVDLIRLPFFFHPLSAIGGQMDYCAQLDLSCPNGQRVDKLISLQFPAFAIHHPNHIAWVMHQHRAVYELYDEQQADTELASLRQRITAFDNDSFARCQQVFANSQRVAERLYQYNQVSATPLYHPPAGSERFYCGEALPYIYCPSRFETLKRQQLLLEALGRMDSPPNVVFSGIGGTLEHCRQLAEDYGLQDKVRFLGHVSEEEKYAFYAHASAIFFAPYDEDYGYITLEAMLSGKPVLTCMDSGGPLEFVQHGETGWVCAADAGEIADTLAWIAANPGRVRDMGQAARQSIQDKGISWQQVIASLLG